MGEVNFVDCTFAEPGTYHEDDDVNPDPGGGGGAVVWPDPPSAGLDPKVGTHDDPGDGGGGGDGGDGGDTGGGTGTSIDPGQQADQTRLVPTGGNVIVVSEDPRYGGTIVIGGGDGGGTTTGTGTSVDVGEQAGGVSFDPTTGDGLSVSEDPRYGGTIVIGDDDTDDGDDDTGGGGDGTPDDIVIVIPPNLRCEVPIDDDSGEGEGTGEDGEDAGDETDIEPGQGTEGLIGDSLTFTFPFEEFQAFDIPGYEGATLFDATFVDEEFSSNIELINLTIEGADVQSIPGGAITGQIKQLPNVDAGSLMPFFEITIPNTPEAVEYYTTNNPTGTIRADFDIVYIADIPGGQVEFVELFRQNVTLTTGLELTAEEETPSDPVIEYAQLILMHYNAASTAIESYLPTTWDLGGNTIDVFNIEVLPSYPAIPDENKYSPNDVSFNPETGQLILFPFAGDLSETLPAGIRITINFSYSDNQQILIPIIPVSDAPTEPQFSFQGTTAVLYFNAPSDSEPTIAIPALWNLAGNTDITFQIMNFSVQPAGTGESGSTWPSNPTANISEELSLNEQTGEISITPFSDAFEVNPGPTIRLEFFWFNDSFDGFVEVDIPLSVVDWPGSNLAMTSGGTGGNTVVQNSVTGASINIPAAYLNQRRTQRDINRFSRVGRRNGGVARSNVVVTNKALSTKAQIKRLKSTAYTNGITAQNYTFYETYTPSPFISENLQTTSVDLFSGKEDFTVRAIQEINRNPQLYEDFVYNSITADKVEKSFSNTVKDLLRGKVALDGRPLSKVVAAAVKQSIVFDEDKFFNQQNIQDLVENGGFSTVEIVKSTSPATNKKRAVNTLINKSITLDPDEYHIKNKNRLLNWKILAEDINKRLVYKKSDLTEENIYLPNSETIAVTDSTGAAHTLEMQDGDYFTVDTVDSTNRLTVFSDREKAKILNLEDTARAFYLCDKTYKIDISCSTPPSSIVELNVDLSTPRNDYYILTLDKSTIEDQLSTDPLFKKTKATYNYVTDTATIDSFIKNKAFPHFTVMIRDDDMFINHLTSTGKVTATFEDMSLDNFDNTPDSLYVRRMPWFFIIVPSDKTSAVVSHQRSKFESFNNRVLSIIPTPQKQNNHTGTWRQEFITEKVITEGGVNFDVDIENGVYYQENREYSVDYDSLAAFDNYATGAPTLPRKRLPACKTLLEVCSIKSDFELGERDSLSFYDLYTRLEPKYFRSLSIDTNNLASFKNNLTRNTVSPDKEINKTYFTKVKEISNIDNKKPTILVDTDETTAVTVFNKSKTTAEAATGATTAPTDASDRLGGGY